MKKNKLLLAIIAVVIVAGYIFIGGGLRNNIKDTADNADFYADEQLAAQVGCTSSTTPQITTISASGVISNSATLNWTTNISATSEVKFWTSPQTASSATWLPLTDASGVTVHSYGISGLTAGKTYSYRVRSTSVPSGCPKTSSTKTFVTTTVGLTAAVIPPVVTGIAVTGLLCDRATLTWSASAGATGYEVYGPNSVCNVNGSAGYCGSTASTSLLVAGLTGSTTYSGSTGTNAGFTVLAYNNAGYAAAAPRYSLTTPACGATDLIAPTTTTAVPSGSWATTNIARTLMCTDNTPGGVGCASTYWQFVNQGTACAAAGTTGYTASTSASTATNGQWRLCFYSKDNANNVETPKFLEIYKLDSIAPTVSLTAPSAGASVSGTAVTLSASASDALSGVASVSFKVDGTTVNTDTSSPYSFVWNTTTASNGSHIISAVASDVAGNTTTSTTVSVSVLNASVPTTPTGLSASALTCTAMTLNWTAVAGATSYEVYGPSSATSCPSGTCGLPTANSLAISGLAGSTTYSGSTGANAGFTVLARNAQGYSSPSTRLSVTTPACQVNAAPVATITAPTVSATYTSSTSTITLGGTATDDTSVASVSWRNQTTTASGSATGTASWTTPAITLANGANTIVITATDGAGLTGTDTITVTYNAVVASAWPATTAGTEIGGGLTAAYEPSGAFWNPADQMLYFVSDTGKITRMDQNGANVTNWTAAGNLEAITATSTYNPATINNVYVVDENTSMLKEFCISGCASPGAYTGKTWSLSIVPTDIANNNGIEGITFVPNGVHPYNTLTTGGVFYVSSQSTGKIYVLNIDLTTSGLAPSLIGTITPNLITAGGNANDISDLYYSGATNKLFVLYDTNNVVHEMRPDGLFINEYTVPSTGATGEEAITTVPTCNATNTSVVLGYDDSGVTHHLYKFSNYPQPCVDSTAPVISALASPVAGTTATVSWNTNEYADSKIEYGVGNYNAVILDVTLKVTNHIFVLPGLTAGTTYQYRVTSKDQFGNSALSTGNFTAPSAGVDPYIVAAGDIAVSGGAQMETSNYILNSLSALAALLQLGDNAYVNGALSDYNSFYDPSWGRSALMAVSHPIPGNHEYQTANATGYFSYFQGKGLNVGASGQGWYSYNVGNWHLVALNTNSECTTVSCAAGSAQEAWLRADLAANPTQCSLAYWHHPRFTSGSLHVNSTATQPLWKAFQDAGGDIVLSGHVHNYERFAPQTSSTTGAGVLDSTNGIREFVVGTGGTNGGNFYAPGVPIANSVFQLGSTNGVLKLTLHPTTYDWQFIRTSDGSILDTGSGTCH